VLHKLYLHRCSAVRQVPGSQAKNYCRSSALLFKSPYCSISSRSSIIPIDFYPAPSSCPQFSLHDFFHQPVPLIICSIPFFFLRTIVSTMDSFSSMLLRTFSCVIFSVQLMRSILLHIHISKAYIFLISFFLSNQVLVQYQKMKSTIWV